MQRNYSVIWKIKISKKLKNKINYHLNKFEVSRADFFDVGIGFIEQRHKVPYDAPDPKDMYRFNEKDEAEKVTWQVELAEWNATKYKKFMEWYGVSERDVLAAALYESLIWVMDNHYDR